MSDDYDPPDYDAELPTGLQPATKVALFFILGCLLMGIILGMIALAHVAKARSEQEKPPSSQPSSRPATVPVEKQYPTNDKENATMNRALYIGMLTLVLVVVIVSEVLIMAWVARDARARGSDGAMWTIAILLSHVIGLLVYLASRPVGMLVVCQHCGNRRLQHMRTCPICGTGKKNRRSELA